MEREPVKISHLIPDNAANIFAQMREETEKQILKGAWDAERGVILQVAQEIFQRDPTPEEFSQFTAIETPGMVDRYELAFKEVIIGQVIRKLDGFNLKIEFIPSSDFRLI